MGGKKREGHSEVEVFVFIVYGGMYVCIKMKRERERGGEKEV